ncbi:MAG: sulfotransferase family 2 domain-containing protein, partial [Bdellovibrionales bacterium]|nr:sulfotransferase family 2 domain-containing protein [Bdellovibrionales bacterium]
RVSPHEFEKYKFVYGQHPFWLKDLMPEKTLFATVLRNPIDRTISHFNYLKNELRPIADKIDPRNSSEFYFVEQVFRKNKDFIDLIEDPTYLAYYVVNYQTRFLTRHSTEQYHFQSPQFSFMEIQQSCQKEILVRAKQNLDRMEFVGTVERLELFLLQMCHRMGWFYPQQTPRYNASKETALQKADLPKSTLEKIEKVTQLDLELYQYANQLLEERTAGLALTPKKINQSYGDFLGRLPRKESILLDFDKPFFGEGWHQREWDPDQQPFRWMGPSTTAYIDFPISIAKDLILSFRVTKSFDTEQMGQMKVTVNGLVMDLQALYVEPDYLSGSFYTRITTELLAKNPAYCRLEFHITKTVRPNDLDPSNPDTRSLGICLGWIHLGPRLL